MRIEHGSVVMLSCREPSVEDTDEVAIWCGWCGRFLTVVLPFQSPDERLEAHLLNEHGVVQGVRFYARGVRCA